MNCDVQIVDSPTQWIAVLTGEATPETLALKLREMFDEFYRRVDLVDTGKRGLNVIYYPAWHSTRPFPIEVGIKVDNSFPESGGIVCSKIPAGRAATALHLGPYSQLHKPHGAIRRWCADRGLELAGASWEAYGHWNKDPNQCSTAVYYLLA